MALRVLIVFLLLGTLACSKDSSNSSPQRPTISFWHMWSEPHQAEIIDSLVEVFENTHGVDVEVTLLSWANAKQKIDLAINSGVAPDVFHSSIDWVHEYRAANVVDPVTNFDTIALLPAARSACGDASGQLYAYPWTLNTRTFVAQIDSLEAVNTWTEFISQAKIFGLPTYEQYNVSKKVLPVIWAYDRKFLSDFPFSTTISEQTILAFKELRNLAKRAIIKPSRELDVDLLNGALDATITGAWILDMASARKPEVELQIDGEILPKTAHSEVPPSLLGGDCLAIAASTNHVNKEATKGTAEEFATYMTLGPTVETLITLLPEAGQPAMIGQDSTTLDAFAYQLTNTRTLRWSPRYTEILETIEKAIVAVYVSDIPVDNILSQLEEDLKRLES